MDDVISRTVPGEGAVLQERQSTRPVLSSRLVGREEESKFGTQLTPTGVRFRLWAPQAKAVEVKIYEPKQIVPMRPLPRGWFEVEVEGAGPGSLYRFVLEDGTEVPDPASRFQPEDVHGPSEVIDPRSYRWHDIGWRGRPWEECIFYELHVGTFSPEGTFHGVIGRLDYLVDLGITAIQLMPIADFAGRWNWGYDGAMLFAPDSSYGRPEDLKALVDAAHARGLMMFLDVVYNHYGPKGNYMSVYAPVVTDKHSTPWGPAVNFDDEGSRMIRDFVFANARHWLNEYRFDGLRFDAVHAIKDDGPKHMLETLAEQIRASTDGRHIHLVAENSRNQAGWLVRRDDGTPRLYTAQWSDDIHHLLHWATTGEDFWYYADYAGRIDLLGRALAEGFAWQGEFRQHENQPWGEPSGQLPPTAFVSFIQNHDHIGNRPFGERIGQLAPEQAVRTIAAIMLLSPQVPLFFMGEEAGVEQPFLYFSDVGPELAEDIRQSRKDEMKKIPCLEERGTPPDPMAEETFRACKLDLTVQAEEDNRLRSLYRRLVAIRKEQIIPRLQGIEGHASRYQVFGSRAFQVVWKLGDGSELSLTANLGPEPLDGVNVWADDHLWLEGFATGHTLEPWSAVFRLTEGQVLSPN